MDLLANGLRAFGKIAGSAARPFLPAAIGSLFSNVLSGINQRSARRWEEDMYLKYNSPSALVRQYDDAGINPALMFGGSTPAAPTDTSAAPVFEPQTGTVTDMLGQLMQLSLLDEDRRGKRLANDALERQNRIGELYDEVTADANLNEILARIDKISEDTRLTKYERQVIGPLREAFTKAQTRGQNASAFLDEWRGSYMRKFNADPDADPIRQALSDLLLDIYEARNTQDERRENRKKRWRAATRWRAESTTD